MGFWESLFGLKRRNNKRGIDVNSLETNLNETLNEGIKKGKSQKEIESDAKKTIKNFTSNLEESLVAKPAAKWKCSVCETENHGSTKCQKCGYDMGSWKCPECGNIVTGDDEYGPLEKSCECGFDYADI